MRNFFGRALQHYRWPGQVLNLRLRCVHIVWFFFNKNIFICLLGSFPTVCACYIRLCAMTEKYKLSCTLFQLILKTYVCIQSYTWSLPLFLFCWYYYSLCTMFPNGQRTCLFIRSIYTFVVCLSLLFYSLTHFHNYYCGCFVYMFFRIF